MTDLFDHLETISDFLLELTDVDINNSDERIKLRVLYHKFNEQIELVHIIPLDKADRKYQQTMEVVKETNKQIKTFKSREKSLPDLIPFLETLLREVNNLLQPYIKRDNVNE